MTQIITIKDTRNKLADIINQVSVAGDVFVVTKFGQPKAMIVPIAKGDVSEKSGIEESFGAWSKRRDLKDSNRWVANLRAKLSKRYE